MENLYSSQIKKPVHIYCIQYCVANGWIANDSKEHVDMMFIKSLIPVVFQWFSLHHEHGYFSGYDLITNPGGIMITRVYLLHNPSPS